MLDTDVSLREEETLGHSLRRGGIGFRSLRSSREYYLDCFYKDTLEVEEMSCDVGGSHL